jgi:hypothetical protein
MAATTATKTTINWMNINIGTMWCSTLIFASRRPAFPLSLLTDFFQVQCCYRQVNGTS